MCPFDITVMQGSSKRHPSKPPGCHPYSSLPTVEKQSYLLLISKSVAPAKTVTPSLVSYFLEHKDPEALSSSSDSLQFNGTRAVSFSSHHHRQGQPGCMVSRLTAPQPGLAAEPFPVLGTTQNRQPFVTPILQGTSGFQVWNKLPLESKGVGLPGIRCPPL